MSGVRGRQHVIVSTRCDADSAGGGGGGGVGGRGVGQLPAVPVGLGVCCASVNFDCNEGIILQV